VAVTVGLVHAAAVGIVSLSLGDLLVDPWNPYVGIVALLAYFLCAWGAAKGDGWLLLAAVGAALLALACWSGPLVDEIRHEEGNLRELAADQAGRSFGVPAPWLGAGSGLVGLLHPRSRRWR
jgi:hypothetical protein